NRHVCCPPMSSWVMRSCGRFVRCRARLSARRRGKRKDQTGAKTKDEAFQRCPPMETALCFGGSFHLLHQAQGIGAENFLNVRFGIAALAERIGDARQA